MRESGLFGGGGDGAAMDRKRIKDTLEMRSSTSTSRGVSAKERERLAAGKPLSSLGKVQIVSDGGKRLSFANLRCSSHTRITFIIVYELPHCLLCLEDVSI